MTNEKGNTTHGRQEKAQVALEFNKKKLYKKENGNKERKTTITALKNNTNDKYPETKNTNNNSINTNYKYNNDNTNNDNNTILFILEKKGVNLIIKKLKGGKATERIKLATSYRRFM